MELTTLEMVRIDAIRLKSKIQNINSEDDYPKGYADAMSDMIQLIEGYQGKKREK